MKNGGKKLIKQNTRLSHTDLTHKNTPTTLTATGVEIVVGGAALK